MQPSVALPHIMVILRTASASCLFYAVGCIAPGHRGKSLLLLLCTVVRFACVLLPLYDHPAYCLVTTLFARLT